MRAWRISRRYGVNTCMYSAYSSAVIAALQLSMQKGKPREALENAATRDTQCLAFIGEKPFADGGLEPVIGS